jgi:hypothetical protein
MKSLAHPDWPYSGTPWEWRGFADQPVDGTVELFRADGSTSQYPVIDGRIVYQKQNFGPELK